MTDDQDSEFEKYLAGESGVSDAYARLPGAEPPAYLDYAIRDEAHRVAGIVPGRASVRARMRAGSSGWRAWQKWTLPLSVAATLVIVAMVGLQLPYITGQAPEPSAPAAMPQAAPAAAPPAAAVLKQPEAGGAIAERKRAAPAPSESAAKPEANAAAALQDRVRGSIVREKDKAAPAAPAPAMREAPAAAPAAMAPVAAPAAMQAAPAIQEKAAPPAREPAPAPVATEAAPAVEPQAVLAPATRKAPAAMAPVTAPGPWLARIRQLKKEGRRAEAKQALAGFSKRYPAYPVPDDLRDLR